MLGQSGTYYVVSCNLSSCSLFDTRGLWFTSAAICGAWLGSELFLRISVVVLILYMFLKVCKLHALCWTQTWITRGVLVLSRLHESDSCSAFVLPRIWIHAYLLLSRWKWIPDSDLNFLKKWIYFKVDSEFSVKFSLKIIKDTLNLFWLDEKILFFFFGILFKTYLWFLLLGYLAACYLSRFTLNFSVGWWCSKFKFFSKKVSKFFLLSFRDN